MDPLPTLVEPLVPVSQNKSDDFTCSIKPYWGPESQKKDWHKEFYDTRVEYAPLSVETKTKKFWTTSKIIWTILSVIFGFVLTLSLGVHNG